MTSNLQGFVAGPLPGLDGKSVTTDALPDEWAALTAGGDQGMRVFAHWAVVGCVAATTMLARTPSSQPRDAASVLAAARQALGGETKLSAVKSFTAVGRTRQVRGDNLVPIEFEIFVELPDKYLRKDEVPAQESGPTATGFDGERLAAGSAAARASAAPPGGAGRIRRCWRRPGRRRRHGRETGFRAPDARHVRARRSLRYPLTFTYVGEAEAPQGKADVIDAKGPDNFTIRLFIEPADAPADHGELAGRGGRPRSRRPGMPMPPGAPPPAGRGAAPAGEPAGAAPRLRANAARRHAAARAAQPSRRCTTSGRTRCSSRRCDAAVGTAGGAR